MITTKAAARFAAFPAKPGATLAEKVAAAMGGDRTTVWLDLGTPAALGLEELCYHLDAGDGMQCEGLERRFVYEFEDGSAIVLMGDNDTDLNAWSLRDRDCEAACIKDQCACNIDDEDNYFVSTDQQRLMDEDDERSAFNDTLEMYRNEF